MAEGYRHNVLSIMLWFVCCSTYLCLGMVVFVAIEAEETNEIIAQKKKMQESLQTELRSKLNISQVEYEELVKRAAEAYSLPFEWNYLSAFAFVFQTVTTIGYGYITPNTTSGRLFCIFYALFGIPLAALLLQATGGAIFAVLRQLIVRIERKLKGNDAEGVKNAELKSLIGSLILLTIVILLFSSAFGYKNGTFVEGVYSWFITLSTIGYGDIVPGLHSNNLLMVWLRVIFMFLGLSITASVLNSLASWISKRDLKVCRCCCAGMTNKIVKARWTRESYSLEMEEKGREGKYRNNSNTVEQASGKQDGDTKY